MVAYSHLASGNPEESLRKLDTPLAALNQLEFERFPFVAGALLYHPNASTELRLRALKAIPKRTHGILDDFFQDFPLTAGELHEFIKISRPVVRAAVARHPQTREDDLLKLGKLKNREIRYALAHNPNTPAEVLAKLLREAEPTERVLISAVIRHPAFSLELALAEAGRRFPDFCYALAARKDIPLEALQPYLAEPNDDVRRSAWMGIARHAQATSEQLAELAQSALTQHRAQNQPSYVLSELLGTLAEHPRLPAEFLTELATDQTPPIRLKVAQQRRTPAAALAQLAHDPEKHIASAAISNPSTPLEVLLELQRSSEVTDHSARATGWLEAIKGAGALVTVTAIGRQPLAAGLVSSPDIAVRIGVAQHPQATPEVLIQLASDQHYLVLQALLGQPALPAEVWQILLDNPHFMAQTGMAQHPAVPDSVLTRLAEWDRDEQTSRQRVIRQAARCTLRQRQVPEAKPAKTPDPMRFWAFPAVQPQPSSA